MSISIATKSITHVARYTCRYPTFSTNSTIIRRACSSGIDQKVAEGPLSGIRVLDLSRVLAGPYATMMMADLGADVIKVERIDGGDDTRQWKPPQINGVSSYFLSVNRNKRSLAVDFRHPEGRQLLHDLVKDCDVMIENFIPGKLKDLGLDYETMSAINPTLIYCSISGFGSTGPYSQRPGYDLIASAVGGLMYTTGPENGPPCKTGVALTDLMTGLQAYGAVSSALFALRSKQYKAVRSGDQHQEIRGQHIECSLLETQVSALTHLASNYLLTGQEARRRGTSHASIVPYQAFATSDGYMMVAAMNNKQFKDLCCVLDVSHLLDDHRFNENERRVANRDDLLPQLEARLQTQSTSEWMKVLQGASVGCAPINSVGQALNDEQVLHLNLIQTLEHPVAGPIKTVGLPVSFSQTPGSVRTAPPLLGEHTSELLSEFLQKTPIEITDLRDRGVVA